MTFCYDNWAWNLGMEKVWNLIRDIWWDPCWKPIQLKGSLWSRSNICKWSWRVIPGSLDRMHQCAKYQNHKLVPSRNGSVRRIMHNSYFSITWDGGEKDLVIHQLKKVPSSINHNGLIVLWPKKALSSINLKRLCHPLT